MPYRQADAADRAVLKRSLRGRRRAPGAPAPQEDDPGRRETEFDPLGALPALLPARVVADLGVEPHAGARRLEHALVGGELLRIVQRGGRPAAVDGVARAERLHRRRAGAEGASDPIVASALLDPTADVVYELPERYPLIYSHDARHRPHFWLQTREPLHAVAGCATGSTHPIGAHVKGRASWPLPSFPLREVP